MFKKKDELLTSKQVRFKSFALVCKELDFAHLFIVDSLNTTFFHSKFIRLNNCCANFVWRNLFHSNCPHFLAYYFNCIISYVKGMSLMTVKIHIQH